MDNAEFKFLRDWADVVACNIFINEGTLPICFAYKKKIQSIILESMSTANGWKSGK